MMEAAQPHAESGTSGMEQLGGATYHEDVFQQVFCSLVSVALLAAAPFLPLKETLFNSSTRLQILLGDKSHPLVSRAMDAANLLFHKWSDKGSRQINGVGLLSLIASL